MSLNWHRMLKIAVLSLKWTFTSFQDMKGVSRKVIAFDIVLSTNSK